jgi:hypothetical protein
MKGKISEKEIATLKEVYPKGGLFKWPSKDKNHEIVFRAIDSSLMEKILNMIRDAELTGRGLPIQDVNEKIFDACVLWPEFSLDEKMALPVGVIPSVVKSIQEKSGFIDIDIFQRVLAPDTFTTTVRDFDFWGDLEDEDAKKLKEDCKPFALYRTRIGRFVFVIRPMTRIDLQVASQANDDQLTLAKSVTMWPKDVPWEHIPAGIIDILGRKANEISGWTETESEVEDL